MNYFLENIASWTVNHFVDDLHNLQFVFPNKRSGVFFRYYLSKFLNKPAWSPAITDIDSFFAEETRYRKADKTELIFELYKTAEEIFNNNNQTLESIDRFYPWASIIINDFSEIDKNLAKPADVFRLIQDIKEIDSLFDYLTDEQIEILKSFWSNINLSRKSEEKDNFLSVLKLLPELYTGLSNYMQTNRAAYDGFYYRKLAESAKQNQWQPKYQHIIFAGFNLLTKAESTIFDYLKKNVDCYFFLDYDSNLIEKKNFYPFKPIRQNLLRFPAPDDFHVETKIPLQQKKFYLTAANQQAGQVKALGNIINQELYADSGINTAIVLSDEKLLIPLIHSLPSHFSDANITMGYPVGMSYLSDYVKFLAQIRKELEKNIDKLHHKTVIKFLNQPIIRQSEPGKISDLIQKITKGNIVWLQTDDLISLHPVLRDIINTDSSLALSACLAICIKTTIEKTNLNFVENEVLFQIYKHLNIITAAVENKEISINNTLFVKLIDEILKQIRIPFSGEPLSGIQIMGILETRCLDFKNLIILSLNEGIWPAITKEPSFISYQVRKAFGLSTPEHHDQVFAYYFYRLINRAENIHFLYNAEPDAIGGGEKSRYLLQLIYDLNVKIQENIFSFPVTTGRKNDIDITKEGIVKDLLFRYSNPENNKFLSPSALLTYLDCSLRFCLQYVFNIREPDDTKEEIDAVMLGNIVHRSLQILYLSVPENEIISSEIIAQLEKNYDTAVQTAITEVFFKNRKNEDLSGINLILQKVIKKYVKLVLEYDKKNASFNILSLEKKDYNISLPLDNENKHVIVSGYIDRIDIRNNNIRIIDYKTGIEDTQFSSIENLFLKENENRNKAAFQLLFYSLLFSEHNNSQFNILPQLYVVGKMAKSSYNASLLYKNEENKTVELSSFGVIRDEFMQNLRNLVSEIFNTELSFSQCQNTKICSYCPFKSMCKRV